MGNERVDQRPVRISRGWMHDEASRLFDNDEVVVFVDDLKRDVLPPRNCRYRRRNADHIDVAWFDPEIAVSYRFARMSDCAAFDQLLKARTAYIAECGGKKTVEPPSRVAAFRDGAARGFNGGICV